MARIQQECRILLDDYVWAVNKLAKEFYDMSYGELPDYAKKDVKAGVKTYVEMRINDLIERGK